ncbi:MAG: sugar kinase [Bacilli bacterium]|jgi:2-dehydro-3-deoxygluconokinase
MAKIITMGEIMLRLSPPNHLRFIQSSSFDAVYGGGEANVAVSLANYHHDVVFVTKVPKNEIGTAAINSLRHYGVDTKHIVRGGERLGIYFLEIGASMRPSKVLYDRSNSAIALADPEEFDFDAIFKDADWFHFTGITPAISPQGALVTLAALKAAKKHHVMVSVDLNYRQKLWTPAQAQKTMTELMTYVDVCIGNEEDAQKCLGFDLEKTDIDQGKLPLASYQKIFQEMKEKFGFQYIASSLRESISASDNKWMGLIYDGNEFYASPKYDIRIIDRVGGGDSFASGLIHGFITKKNMKEALDFAVAASALKHTIFGDYNLVSIEEVESLMQGNASGRVQR